MSDPVLWSWAVVIVLMSAACGGDAADRSRSLDVRDGAPSWSPDGERIAFYSERDGNSEIYVMNADGTGRKRLTNNFASDGYPTWSPDGTRIAFDSDRGGPQSFDIYVMDADGSNPVRLTTHPKRDLNAAWSPDGSTIAFMSERGMAQGWRIWLMDADGSNPRLLSVQTDQDFFPQWSFDGEQITYHYGEDVHVINADGTGLQRLTYSPLNGMYPSWSPDASRIVFMSWREGGPDFTEIYTMNADGSEQAVLTETLVGTVIDPRWSPDGSRILYAYLPGGYTVSSGPMWIYVMDSDGGNQTLLSGVDS